MAKLQTTRAGVTSVLAMLYLVLFALLAIGFYAATTVASQVVQNDLRSAQALLAAETGMDFMRFVLHGVRIPPDVPPEYLLDEVVEDLQYQLDGTGNLGSNEVALIGNKIQVPVGANKYIQLGTSNLRFRAEITRGDTPDTERHLYVTVVGGSSGIATAQRSAIRLTYTPEERPTDFFDYGMASQGTFTLLTKNIITADPPSHGSVLSFSTADPPVTIGTSSGTPGGISGDITIMPGTTPLIYPGWTVDGTTSQSSILADSVDYLPPVDGPTLPVPGFASYDNIIIPPNMNPTFNGPCTIRGVVYVQQPNKVSFSGHVDITGIIVSEGNGVGTLVSNQLVFSGNGGSKLGVEALPDEPQFSGLKDLGGSFIIAPDFDVQFSGNFGNLNGHIVGDKVTLSGNTSSTVKGSLVALNGNLTIGGNSAVSLLYDPNQKHVGLRFDDRYIPDPASYVETRP